MTNAVLRSMILSERPNDDDAVDGFTKWPFMTTHTWAEYPRGKWTLEVVFINGPPQSGSIMEWTLLVSLKYFLNFSFLAYLLDFIY